MKGNAAMPVYRSRTSTAGRHMAGARALWRATGGDATSDSSSKLVPCACDCGQPAHGTGEFYERVFFFGGQQVEVPALEVGHGLQAFCGLKTVAVHGLCNGQGPIQSDAGVENRCD